MEEQVCSYLYFIWIKDSVYSKQTWVILQLIQSFIYFPAVASSLISNFNIGLNREYQAIYYQN